MKTFGLFLVALAIAGASTLLQGRPLFSLLGFAGLAFGLLMAACLDRKRQIVALIGLAGLAVAVARFLAFKDRPGTYWPCVGLYSLDLGAILVVAAAVGALLLALGRRRDHYA